MERSFKKSMAGCFWVYLLLNLVLFLLFYIPNYIIEDYAYIVGDFEYVRLFFSMLLEFLIGVSGAVVLYVILLRTGGVTLSRVLPGSAVIAAATFINSLPYYYLYFLAYGYDSIDGIPLYTLSALLSVIFEWIKLLLLFSLCYFVSRRHIMKELTLTLPKNQQKKVPKKVKRELHLAADSRLSDELAEGGMFNFDSPITLGILLASAGQFVYAFAVELKNAVEYLTEFAGNYRTGEIIYMTWSFIFILVELAVCHALCHALKNFLAKKLK